MAVDEGELLAAGFQHLKARCDAAKLECEEPDPDDLFGTTCFVIRIRGLKPPRGLSIDTVEKLGAVKASKFERLHALTPFVALYDPKEGWIEAKLGRLVRNAAALDMKAARSIFGMTSDASKGAKIISGPVLSRQQKLGARTIDLTIGPCKSTILAILADEDCATLRLDGVGEMATERAVEVLQRFGDAVLFQADFCWNIPLRLERHFPLPHILKGKPRNPDDIQFPEFQFDPEPMELYWYGRGAGGMPLLQFLAFYQVLEYFFPMYSEAEARRRVAAVLKTPGFSASKESDLIRVLSASRPSGGRTYFDESEQLSLTVRGCIGDAELRDYIKGEARLMGHLATKNSRLSAVRITQNELEGDVAKAVAARLYDIRCRIVHSKAEFKDGKESLILPFSEEADTLRVEIPLVRHIAQKVLVANSHPLSIDS